MTWIKTIEYAQSSGRLRRLYDRVKGPGNNVDNIMMAHSLRPHTMEGHMAIYKNVLHHSSNSLPKWVLELIGVWVSILNDCQYCVEHHYAGMRRLLEDDQRSHAIMDALKAHKVDLAPVEEAHKQALHYAECLTINPAMTDQAKVRQLRDAGLTDGEILEINQVTSYFAYANRTVLGLGISTTGDIIGLSPNNSDDPDDWAHS